MAYDPAFSNNYLNVGSLARVALVTSRTGTTAAGLPLPAVPTGPHVRSLLAANLTTGVFDPRTFNETSVPPNFEPQMTHEWTLGIQREISGDDVVEARVAGNSSAPVLQTPQATSANLRFDTSTANPVPVGVLTCTSMLAPVP